jgi:hypothetical protein
MTAKKKVRWARELLMVKNGSKELLTGDARYLPSTK